MKIYTKTGDKGQTSLFGGERVSKDHIRLEAYGSIDELIANLGLVIDVATDETDVNTLRLMQAKLMVISSILATEKLKLKNKLPQIYPEDISIIESEIDRLNEKLPVLRTFIIPGGYLPASHVHVARTVCRRAERRVISLSKIVEVDILVIQYLNRMSDYLFVLARSLTHEFNHPEHAWNPDEYKRKD